MVRQGSVSLARDLAQARQNQKFMYCIYALKNQKNNDLYIGYSGDIKSRLKFHNQGKVKSTKPYRPWMLVYYEAYKNKNDARKREYQLKKHYYKDELKKRLKNSS